MRLSKKSGVEYNSIAKYLQGKVSKPRGNTIQALADALGVDKLWLQEGVMSGAGDRGSNWEAETSETYVEPIYHQDWLGELTPKRFQRFAAPLIADLVGDAPAKGLKADFFKRESKTCLQWLEAARHDEPGTPVTDHLAQYLIFMLAALSPQNRESPDYRRWWRAARQTAHLLAGPSG